jgi:hypothetical protein
MRHVNHTRGARGLVLLLLLLLAATGLGAQTLPGMEQAPPAEPVSDGELQDFASAYGEVQVLQQELDLEINSTLEDSEMDPDRFFALNQMAQESDPSEGLPGVSDDELTEYRDLLGDLMAIQETMENRMVSAVEEEDLTVERFNEIIVAIQQDQELAERAQSYIQEAVGSDDDQG